MIRLRALGQKLRARINFDFVPNTVLQEEAMNVNEVAKNWKKDKTAPKWNEDEHAQVTVDMAKRYQEELEKAEKKS
jgi:hypothetical protein